MWETRFSKDAQNVKSECVHALSKRARDYNCKFSVRIIIVDLNDDGTRSLVTS